MLGFYTASLGGLVPCVGSVYVILFASGKRCCYQVWRSQDVVLAIGSSICVVETGSKALKG